jgi:hypothetical protein
MRKILKIQMYAFLWAIITTCAVLQDSTSFTRVNYFDNDDDDDDDDDDLIQQPYGLIND